MVGTAAPLKQVVQVLRPDNCQTDYSPVLLRLAGPYDIAGDWVVLRSAVDNDPTGKVCEMADEIGFIDQDLVERELTRWGIDPAYHREWLTRTGKIREINGRLARWEGSIGDKLIIGLADLGRPATLDTLLDHVHEDRTKGSALNALSGDHRAVRVNRTEWALATWGLPEYSSIAMSIRNLVSESGGPVHIGEVITRIQHTFWCCREFNKGILLRSNVRCRERMGQSETRFRNVCVSFCLTTDSAGCVRFRPRSSIASNRSKRGPAARERTEHPFGSGGYTPSTYQPRVDLQHSEWSFYHGHSSRNVISWPRNGFGKVFSGVSRSYAWTIPYCDPRSMRHVGNGNGNKPWRAST